MTVRNLQQLAVGDALPERQFKPDNVQLFMYNAALWNAHLIHYDFPYATEEEGYPGLVIAGPLLGDWMHQCVQSWMGSSGHLCSVEYSNRAASYIGEVLTSGGRITSFDVESGEVNVELFIKNENGDVIAPGAAVVRFEKG